MLEPACGEVRILKSGTVGSPTLQSSKFTGRYAGAYTGQCAVDQLTVMS